MSDEHIDVLARKVILVKERIHRHGKISPPVGKHEPDRITVADINAALQRRSCFIFLLFFCLIYGLIVIDRIAVFRSDLEDTAACCIRRPLCYQLSIVLERAVFPVESCACDRIYITRKICVSDSAEIHRRRFFYRHSRGIIAVFRRTSAGSKHHTGYGC